MIAALSVAIGLIGGTTNNIILSKIYVKIT
jgi:hypothetical protein